MDDIVNKIRNLRAKANDAGASEAEAIAAAQMAAKLMLKHDIDEAKLADKYNPSVVEAGYRPNSTKGTKCPQIIRSIWVSVQDLTETKVYWSNEYGQVKVIGTEGDVEMSLYLFELIAQASRRQAFAHWHEWRENNPEVQINKTFKAAKIDGYVAGFGQRISERLNAMAKERQENRATSNSTALVVKKDSLIKTHMEETGLRLSKGRASNRQLDRSSMAKGHMDGDKLNLGRPFGAATSQEKLG